jgi:hypothetical protein
MILLVTVEVGTAAEGKAGHGGAFLRIPVGARPAGMGNAFVSVADDANALYFNPGGLYQVKGLTVGTMYSIMSMDRSHLQGSFIYEYEKYGTLSVMFTKFGVSDIDGRDSQGNPTGSFDDSEIALAFGFGKKVHKYVGVGGAFKYLRHSLKDNKATGIGFDIGAHSRKEIGHSILNSVLLGISVSNLGSSLEWDTESSHKDDVPSTLRVGSGLNLTIREIGFLALLEVSRTSKESSDFHGGVETWLYKMLGIRTGVDGGDFTFGVSVLYDKFRFDYAFSADKLEEGSTSKIGVQVIF